MKQVTWRFFMVITLVTTLYACDLSGSSAPKQSSPEPIEPQDVISTLTRTSVVAKDALVKSFIYKRLGDEYFVRDNISKSADSYIDSLALSKEYPNQDILTMVERISWDARYEQALSILEEILGADHDNVEVRVLYAKILSWADRLEEALSESQLVLDKIPEQKAALLVKANALNWTGEGKSAIPIYKSLLKEDNDNFDILLGLGHALLSQGDIKGAGENFDLLKAETQAQEDLKDKALRALESARTEEE